tara:strand:- start:153 stop:440 length:288 start_codon:yes stop_codon:yes gene_type:complete
MIAIMKIQNYIISSANWDIEVDGDDCKSAAQSGVIMAMKNYGKKLLMSTVVMVRLKNDKPNDFSNAEFFASHEIFNDIGYHSLAEEFKQLGKLIK